MDSLKVVQVVPRATTWHTGPTVAGAALARALGRRGVQVCIHGMMTRDCGMPPEDHGWYIYRGICLVPGSESTRFSLRMVARIRPALRECDVVYNNGMWSPITVATAVLAQKLRRPMVWCPRGTLSAVALEQKSGRKRIQWRLWQERLVRAASCLHVTSETEAKEVRALGIDLPLAVLPHGVEVPDRVEELPTDRLRDRRLLFLSRLHPVKGLPILLRAWAGLEANIEDWELVIAGPSAGDHRAEMERLAEKLKLRRVRFIGSVNGDEKNRVYQSADLFVLPSMGENFGMAIAEAMANGLPVIVSRNTPWKEVACRRCGWQVEATVADLHTTLREATSQPRSYLEAMGERGRRWMEQEYSWHTVAEKMELTYRWVLDGGVRPEWVRTRHFRDD